MVSHHRSTDTRRRDFPQRKPLPRKGNRSIKPGPKAEVRWDALEANEVLTGQHVPDDISAARTIEASLPLIAKLEEDGKFSKARRIRKELNLAEDARWAVRSSWCPTCLNVFHNCICPPPDMPNKVSIEFIQSIFGREDREVVKARKKEEAKAQRKARKEALRENR